MIQSQINPKIQYNTANKINVKDVGQNLNLYEYEVFPDTPPIMVAVGVQQTHAKDNTFVYHYLYATVDTEQKGKFQRTLGVIEIPQDEYLNVLDEDGDLDLDKTMPLLFIDKKTLLEIHKQQMIEPAIMTAPTAVEIRVDSDDSEAEEEKALLEPITRPNPNEKEKIPHKNTLLEGRLTVEKSSQYVESKEEAQKLIEEFKGTSGSHEWVQERMKNTHYSVVPVPGDGDCFFHVVCQAFASVGLQTTVASLRSFLANHPSVEKTFKQEQQIFSEFASFRAVLTNNNATITARLKEIADLKTGVSEQDKATLAEEKRTLLANRRRNEEKIADIQSDIDEIVPHMEKLQTKDEYREYIKTRDFWANEWAIETLEKKLQVKFILFPKDDDVIYTVGTLNKPNRYILTAFVSGNHYELIQYNQTRVFLSFDSLPYSVKCLGAKYKFKIADFIHFRCEISGGGGDEADEEEEEEQEKFVLSDRAKPHVFKKEQKAHYFELRRKQNRGWERVLADDFVVNQPLVMDGLKWNSVSHYVLAGHFHPHSAFYKNFSAESNTLISTHVSIAEKAVENPGDYSWSKREKGRGVSNNSRKITDKNVLFVPIPNVQRDTLSKERVEKRRQTALLAKLKNPLVKHLLLSTREARLFQNDLETEDTLLERLRSQQNVVL